MRRVREEIDRNYADRMLLAEANQWPSDVRPYFGEGDECHMAFHFPLMPRIYMALRKETRTPIVEILAQTPEIPSNSQWGLFLRNHDELTLEMVTEDERDYMYSGVRARPAHAGQYRHSSPPGAASGQQQTTAGAAPQSAIQHARYADPVLRRRDRHGR